jgi:hypothetical protein
VPQKSTVLIVLRSLSVLLVVIYAAAIYAEWNFNISPESRQYQLDYPDAIRSGLSLQYLCSKIAWSIGTIAGLFGVARILFFRQRGLFSVALSAPLVALAAFLQAPQSNYPSVEPMFVFLLWCTSCAVWAGVVALAWASEA